MTGGPELVGLHRARLRELPGLARIWMAKSLEHDKRYEHGGRFVRAFRRTEELIGAWGQMLSRDVWTDGARDAVLCEPSGRWPRPRFFMATTAIALVLFPLLQLPHGVWIVGAIIVAPVLAFRPTLLGDYRRMRRHRRGATVLTFLASRRPGAGRALLDARCAAADARQAWLCLDAPIELEGFYNGSGFRSVGDPEVSVGRTLIYMERPPQPLRQPGQATTLRRDG